MHDQLDEKPAKLFVPKGNYEIYINVTDAEKPWVIRYPDDKSLTFHNEVKVASIITSNVWMRSVEDKFIEGKLGRWKIFVFNTSLLVDGYDIASFGNPAPEAKE